MTTMTIQVPGKAKTKLSAIVKEMGGEIISISTDKQAAKKARLLNQIKQGLEEVCEGELASEVCEEAQGYQIGEGGQDALRKEEQEKGDTMEGGEGDHRDEKRNRDDECSWKGDEPKVVYYCAAIVVEAHWKSNP